MEPMTGPPLDDRPGPTRRAFLRVVAGGAATALAGSASTGCSPRTEQRRSPDPNTSSAMKLSLSVRVAESFKSKEESSMTFAEIVELATSLGYEAICMRASQGGIQTEPERLREMRRQLDAAGLPVSMVTGDFAVPRNDEPSFAGWRQIQTQ